MQTKFLVLFISTIILSLFFILNEIKTILTINNQRGLESELVSLYKEMPFYSYEKKITSISKLINEQGPVKTPAYDHQNLYAKARLTLSLALESKDIEEKITHLCDARELFISASKLSPNKLEYHIAITDIESFSPYLIVYCNNKLKKTSLDINNNSRDISTKERINLIKELSPTYPTTLYQVGLIEKNIGNRIDAMRSFRQFEEKSINNNTSNVISYLLSQVQNREEMIEILPRKLNKLLTWLNIYNRNKSSNNLVEYFEQPLIETINIIEQNENSDPNHIDPNYKNIIKNSLYDAYWSRDVQKFSKFKNTLYQYLHKQAVLNNDNQENIDFFKKLSYSNKLPCLASTNLSNISKKSSQIFNWLNCEENTQLIINEKTDAIGLYIPNPDKVSSLLIQGAEGELLPENLLIEAWTSEDNNDYSLTQSLKSSISNKISGKSVKLFTDFKVKSPYIKIYFTSNDKVIKLNSPLNLAVQLLGDN